MPPELVLNQTSGASQTLLMMCGSLGLSIFRELCWHAEGCHAAPRMSG